MRPRTHIVDVPNAGRGVDVVPQQVYDLVLRLGHDVERAAGEGPLAGIIALRRLAEDGTCPVLIIRPARILAILEEGLSPLLEET